MSAGWADAVASAPNVKSARIATKATVLLRRLIGGPPTAPPLVGLLHAQPAAERTASPWADLKCSEFETLAGPQSASSHQHSTLAPGDGGAIPRSLWLTAPQC